MCEEQIRKRKERSKMLVKNVMLCNKQKIQTKYHEPQISKLVSVNPCLFNPGKITTQLKINYS